MRTSKTRTVALGAAGIAAAVAGWKTWKYYDTCRRNRAIGAGRRIVILGAGFGGLNAAQELVRLLPRQEHGQITLIDQNNFLLFTPMLTEVAGGELDARDIVAPPRRLSHRIDFQQGRVVGVDLASKSVELAIDGEHGKTRTVRADHLVIALGSAPKFHGIPGVEEHSLPVQTVADAGAIRNGVLASLERASWEQDPKIRREVLTFVVAGGGFTGVETMAAINDLARESTKYYPTVSLDEVSSVIVMPGDRLLPELPPDLASFAQQQLADRGVEILLNTKVTRAGDGFVELEGGRRIATHTLIWAGGVTPNPIVEKLDCKKGKHGGIVVDACCRVPDHPGVWAVGDCAEIPKPDGKGTYAPTAQNSTREGELAARNIVAVLRGEEPKPFTFHAIGELALVGRHAAVGKIYGIKLSGLVAWAIWRAVYLSKIPGAAQRTRILLDWVLDIIFGREIAELPVERSSSVEQFPVSEAR
jgi:NADH dehydrogenase